MSKRIGAIEGEEAPLDVGGPRFLMCPPDYYDTHFMFNPWMTYREKVDRRRAQRQWEQLLRQMEEAGAVISLMEPSQECAAQTFTADGALVYEEGKALLLRNDGRRGHLEPALFRNWFIEHGFATESLPPAYRLDGGNILRLHDGSYLVGLKPSASGRSERYLAKLLRILGGARIRRLDLVDHSFLHLDMVVGKLGDRGYLVYGEGLHRGEASARATVLDRSVIIPVPFEDARNYACNTVTVGDVVFTGPVSRNLRSQVARLGFAVEVVPLTEFYKAGGGAKCLTLPLDAGPPASGVK